MTSIGAFPFGGGGINADRFPLTGTLRPQEKYLADYPCKSAGLVESPYVARAIDSRIRTECIGCPSDEPPDDWFCSCRFSLG